MLENALDWGITEKEFWDMTFAELKRDVASRSRRRKLDEQQRALFDYALAELIGRSVARVYSNSAKMPEIGEVYPSLFDTQAIEEQKAEKEAKLFALKFKQFAAAHNAKMKDGGEVK